MDGKILVNCCSPGAGHMPRVTLKTGITDADGHEEVLHEYFCDWPGCPNVAAHVLGFAREIRVCTVVCDEHAVMISTRKKDSG